MISQAVQLLSNTELIANTRELLRQSGFVDAELLVHLGEIDERELYLERAFPSMLVFCVEELGFSEDAAYSRIRVARAARAFPAMLEALRSGTVHLTGLRLLAPHLTPENHRDVLARAAGKKKEEIEELVVTLAPRPPAPTIFRKLANELPRPIAPPGQNGQTVPSGSGPPSPGSAPPGPSAGEPSSSRQGASKKRDLVEPLSVDAFRIQFTGTRAFRDKLRKAQGLLRHRFPKGEVGTILELALDALIERVEQQRFAKGRKPRRGLTASEGPARSRHIPAAIKREVHRRDGGRCTFQDEKGRRCPATDALGFAIQYDHIDGFARVRIHSADQLRLLCRAHNQYAAEKIYGREFMERARAASKATRSRTSAASRRRERIDPLLL